MTQLKVYPERRVDEAPVAVAPPSTAEAKERPSRRAAAWRRQMTIFNLIFLVLPLALGAMYLWVFATDTYNVEAVLAIRNASAVNSAPTTSMIMMGGGSTSAQRAIDESYAVVRYVQSREAYQDLNKRIGLDERFHNSAIHWVDRLSSSADENDRYKYYLGKIKIYYDDIEGQITLSTYGYTADTAFRMAEELGRMSETLVNKFNERSYTDMIRLAQDQVSQTEKELRDTGMAINGFQFKNSMLDPSVESSQFSTIIANLREQISLKTAEIAATGSVYQQKTPHMAELQSQLSALRAQLAIEQNKLTGQNEALAPLISSYKMLSISQQLAQQKYTAAIGLLQSALIQAEQQKLYVVNIVPVRPPQMATLPERGKDLLLLAAATLVIWLIARMIAAAVRDHHA